MINSLKYLKYVTLGCKFTGIRKLEFVATTQKNVFKNVDQLCPICENVIMNTFFCECVNYVSL